MSVQWIIRVLGAVFQDEKAVYAESAGERTLTGGDTVTCEAAKLKGAIEMRVRPHDEVRHDCLEASFKGRLSAISDQDVVIIYTPGYLFFENPATFYPRFRGRAALRANEGDPSGLAQPYRIIGHRAEFATSVDSNTPYPAQTPLDDLAEAYLFFRPFGLSSFASVPSSVKAPGAVNANYGQLDELLDGLVTLGEAQGQKLAWGASAYAQAFFSRAGGVSRILYEGSDCAVSWPPVQSEQPVTGVRWLLGNGNAKRSPYVGFPGVSLETPDTLSHLSESGGLRGRTLTLDAGDLGGLKALSLTPELVKGTPIASFVGNTQDASFTLSRVSDADSSAYAVVEMAKDHATNDAYLELDLPLPVGFSPETLVAVSLNFKLEGEDERSVYAEYEIQGGFWQDADPFTANEIKLYQGQAASDIERTLVFGDRARAQAGPIGSATKPWVIRLRLHHTHYALQRNGVYEELPLPRYALEDFRLWTVDTAALDAAARGEYVSLPEGTFVARERGLQELTPQITLQAASGTGYSLDVSEAVLRISDKGYETEHRCGVSALYSPQATSAARAVKERDRQTGIKTLKSAWKGP